MTVNVKLLNDTLDAIKANPEHWCQDAWHCGTSHCFAGFVELQSLNLPIDSEEQDLIDNPNFPKGEGLWKTKDNAIKALGIQEEDADKLFHAYNSLEVLTNMVACLSTNGTLTGYGDDDNEDSEGWSGNEDDEDEDSGFKPNVGLSSLD